MYVVAARFPDVAEARQDGIDQFRIRRVLQPALASVASRGTATVLAMAALSVLGLGIGAGALADLAERHRRDPRAGLAVTVVLIFPLIISTTEPLGFGLALLGLALVDRGRWVWGAVALALAGLTRETALVMAVAAALSVVRPHGWRTAGAVLAISFGPLLVWTAWLARLVPADAEQPARILGLLDLPTLSTVEVGLIVVAMGLMGVGAVLWRDVPSLALTCAGYLACCFLYDGESFPWEAFLRLSGAAIAISLAGLLCRPRGPAPATATLATAA
jgi:hypothetical protein